MPNLDVAAKYNASGALTRLTEADVRNKGQQTGNVRFKSGSWYVRFREWRFVDGSWKWADTEKKIDDGGRKLLYPIELGPHDLASISHPDTVKAQNERSR